MTRYRKKSVKVLQANAGSGRSSDKVWFGIWLAWTAFVTIALIGALATGGDWLSLCNMGLTEEEVIRCRDCEHSIRSNGDWFCFQLHKVYGDPTYIESWRMLETKPDGYCAWAVRR